MTAFPKPFWDHYWDQIKPLPPGWAKLEVIYNPAYISYTIAGKRSESNGEWMKVEVDRDVFVDAVNEFGKTYALMEWMCDMLAEASGENTYGVVKASIYLLGGPGHGEQKWIDGLVSMSVKETVVIDEMPIHPGLQGPSTHTIVQGMYRRHKIAIKGPWYNKNYYVFIHESVPPGRELEIAKAAWGEDESFRANPYYKGLFMGVSI